MRSFQNIFETRKRSFISVFSIDMAVSLSYFLLQGKKSQTNLWLLEHIRIIQG